MANFICAGDGINRTARSVRKTQTARFCMGMDRGKSEQHAEEVRKSDQLNREKGSRDSVPCGVWGNAPTVPRATSMPTALNKGAGSEASLPVTLRSRRSAPQLHIRPLTYCRAGWARPTSMGNDLFSRCWSFLLQEVSPLRRRVGGFAVAPDAPSHCTSMFLDFSRCRGNRACGRDKEAFRSPLDPFGSHCRSWFLSLQGELHPQHRSENHYRDSKRLSPLTSPSLSPSA